MPDGTALERFSVTVGMPTLSMSAASGAVDHAAKPGVSSVGAMPANGWLVCSAEVSLYESCVPPPGLTTGTDDAVIADPAVTRSPLPLSANCWGVPTGHDGAV